MPIFHKIVIPKYQTNHIFNKIPIFPLQAAYDYVTHKLLAKADISTIPVSILMLGSPFFVASTKGTGRMRQDWQNPSNLQSRESIHNTRKSPLLRDTIFVRLMLQAIVTCSQYEKCLRSNTVVESLAKLISQPTLLYHRKGAC